MKLSRHDLTLEGEEEALRLRVRVLSRGSWPTDADYVPEESQIQLEAEDLDGLDPHQDLVSEFEVADVSRARELGLESLADLVRQPSYWVEHPAGMPPLPSTVKLSTGKLVTPVQVLEDRTELSYDTAPNRVIKA